MTEVSPADGGDLAGRIRRDGAHHRLDSTPPVRFLRARSRRHAARSGDRLLREYYSGRRAAARTRSSRRARLAGGAQAGPRARGTGLGRRADRQHRSSTAQARRRARLEMVSRAAPSATSAGDLPRRTTARHRTPRSRAPSYEDTLRYYEARSGHKVRHLHYYQVFAGCASRSSCCGSRSRWCTTSSRRPGRARARAQQHLTRLTAKLLELRAPARHERDFSQGGRS